MSSRNVYLNPEQRTRALVLHRSLMRIKRLADAGERETSKLLNAGREELARENTIRLDYFEIVDPDTLDPVADTSEGAVAAIAAFVGTTRLIDNILLTGRDLTVND